MQPLCKTVWSLLKKLKIQLPYDPAILVLPKEVESLSQRNICVTPVYCSIIHNSQDTETACLCSLTEEWINNVIYNVIHMYIYTDTAVLLSHKKGRKFCHLWHRTWEHYAKWNKSAKKRQILYNITYPTESTKSQAHRNREENGGCHSFSGWVEEVGRCW